MAITTIFSMNSYASSESLVNVDMARDAIGHKLVIDSHESKNQTSKYIWLNDANEKIGDGKVLYLSEDVQKQSDYVVGCERRTDHDENVIFEGCSKELSLLDLEGSERDERPVVSNIKLSGFPAIGSVITATYDFTDSDPGDVEDPSKARFQWQFAKKSSPTVWEDLAGFVGDPNFVIPNEGPGPTQLHAGDFIRVIIEARTQEPAQGIVTSNKLTSNAFMIYENYPGGNIVDSYFRPLMIDETSVIESELETHRVDATGETSTAGDAYKFSVIGQGAAETACTELGLTLVEDPEKFATLMNAEGKPGSGGLASAWPKHKIFWTSRKVPDSIWGDYYAIGFEDSSGEFEVAPTPIDAHGLVVCTDNGA